MFQKFLNILNRLKLDQSRKLIIASAFSQIFTVLATPLLVRYAPKEEFGFFGIFFSVVVIYSIVGSLRMELGFVERKKGKKLQSLYSVLFTLSLFIALIFSLIFYLFYNDIFFAFLILIGCIVTINSLQLTFWTISEKNIGAIINFRISKVLLILFFQFIFIFLDQNKGLIIGHILGLSISLLFFFRSKIKFLKLANINSITSYIKQYKKFVYYTTPSDLMNVFGTQLPTFLFGRLYGLDFSAYYYYTQRIALSPFSILSESLSKIYMRSYSLGKDLNLIISKIITFQIKSFIGLYGAIILLNEFIVNFLFGKGWDEMEFFLLSAFLWVFSVFISAPILSLLLVSKNQEVDLKFQFTLLFIRLLAIALGYYLDSYKLMFILFVLSSAWPYLWYMNKTIILLKFRFKLVLNKFYDVLLYILFFLFLIISKSSINNELYLIISIFLTLITLIVLLKEFLKLRFDD